MPVSIDTVTVGGTEDRRLVLANSTAARVLSIGSNWTKLAIGVRWALADTGANFGAIDFAFGMMSAPDATVSNGPNSASCSHFFGWGYTTAFGGWTRYAGPPVSYYAAWRFVRKIGNTWVESASAGHGERIMATQAAGQRVACVIRLHKSGGNMLGEEAYLQESSSKDVSRDNLRGAVQNMAAGGGVGCAAYLNAVVGTTAYYGQNHAGIALNEAANGYLDSIVIAWGASAPALHVSDVVFLKQS